MHVAGRVLRGLSYLFHLALCLFFLGLAIVTWGATNFQIDVMPWRGPALSSWILSISIVGLLVTLLAVTGKLRFLFPLWCVFTLGFAFWALFLNPKSSFDGESGFKTAIWFVVALLVSALVSLPLVGGRRAGRKT